MSNGENSLMVKIMKPLLAILLSAMFSILSYLYMDVKSDVADIKYNMKRLDSLAMEQIHHNKFDQYVDSLQTERMILSFKNLEKQIQELTR